jgi:hypothetical protein
VVAQLVTHTVLTIGADPPLLNLNRTTPGPNNVRGCLEDVFEAVVQLDRYSVCCP